MAFPCDFVRLFRTAARSRLNPTESFCSWWMSNYELEASCLFS